MCSLHDTDHEHRPAAAEECLELLLLMPSSLCAALERAANEQGSTIGQLLRRLTEAYLAELDNPAHYVRMKVQPGVGDAASRPALRASKGVNT
jgi:hypothetical protein